MVIIPVILVACGIANWRQPQSSLQGIPDVGFPLTDCTSKWITIPGSTPLLPLWPDTNAIYSVIPVEIAQGEDAVLLVHGEYPQARYMSYNLNDAETLNPVLSILDRDIEPDTGHTNPFRPQINHLTTRRSYKLAVGRQGSPKLDSYSNRLEIPADLESTKFTLVFRVYAPDAGAAESGQIELPRVWTSRNRCSDFTFDPGRIFSAIMVREVTETEEGGNIYFYKGGDDTGLAQNQETSYLFATLDKGRRDVAVIWIEEPPTTVKNTMLGNEDMRYFSFCLGGRYLTTTSACKTDVEIPTNTAGWKILVISDSSEVKERALSLNMAHLPWSNHLKHLILYRNMVTREDYACNLHNVPPWSKAQDILGKCIPRGRMCTEREFLHDLCGLSAAMM